MDADTATIATEKSAAAYRAAAALMPGAVSWPALDGELVPRFMVRGAGAVLTDVDDNEYIDLACGDGALVLGHADERVAAAITKGAAKGWAFAAPTELATQLAELIISQLPAIEQLRFVRSAAESMACAVRLAKVCTGRGQVVSFGGCGAGDPADSSHTLAYNDIAAAEALFADHGRQIAAVMVEPISVRCGVVLADDGFLQTLRALCDRHGALLIFDETTSGFRVHSAGGQTLCDVQPDLSCLGKIIGGGLPLGAFGGRRDIMARLENLPVDKIGIVQPGNPLAMSAGIATLQALAEPDTYAQLEQRAADLADGMTQAAAEAGCPARVVRAGSMGSVYFAADANGHDRHNGQHAQARSGAFFRAMLDRGVYFVPSQPVRFFVSTAHAAQQIAQVVEAAGEAFGECVQPVVGH